MSSRNVSNVRPPNQSFNPIEYHPSASRSSYSNDMRALAIQNRLSGVDATEAIRNVQQLYLYPHKKTVNRWMVRYNVIGHARSFRRTGNHRARRELRGRNLILLSLYRTFYPTASIAECIAYLYQMNRHDPTYYFHSPSQIVRAETRLCLTRVRSSTSAWQTTQPRVQQWRHNYWNQPYPYGMVGIPTENIIDIDEAGVYPEDVNRKHGKTPVGHRCDSYGFYQKETKTNLLLAISGDPNQAARWYETWSDGGTTIHKFLDFIERILNDIGNGTAERRFCFTMDNLNAHTNGIVTTLILARGHRIVFRAPYCPIDGAIEYVFNVIETQLRVESPNIHDVASLERKMIDIIRSITEFSPFFRHVGFA